MFFSLWHYPQYSMVHLVEDSFLSRNGASIFGVLELYSTTNPMKKTLFTFRLCIELGLQFDTFGRNFVSYIAAFWFAVIKYGFVSPTCVLSPDGKLRFQRGFHVLIQSTFITLEGTIVFVLN